VRAQTIRLPAGIDRVARSPVKSHQGSTHGEPVQPGDVAVDETLPLYTVGSDHSLNRPRHVYLGIPRQMEKASSHSS